MAMIYLGSNIIFFPNLEKSDRQNHLENSKVSYYCKMDSRTWKIQNTSIDFNFQVCFLQQQETFLGLEITTTASRLQVIIRPLHCKLTKGLICCHVFPNPNWSIF